MIAVSNYQCNTASPVPVWAELGPAQSQLVSFLVRFVWVVVFKGQASCNDKMWPKLSEISNKKFLLFAPSGPVHDVSLPRCFPTKLWTISNTTDYQVDRLWLATCRLHIIVGKISAEESFYKSTKLDYSNMWEGGKSFYCESRVSKEIYQAKAELCLFWWNIFSSAWHLKDKCSS